MSATVTPTKGESLLLRRRRKGLNQIEAAKEYGLIDNVLRNRD